MDVKWPCLTLSTAVRTDTHPYHHSNHGWIISRSQYAYEYYNCLFQVWNETKQSRSFFEMYFDQNNCADVLPVFCSSSGNPDFNSSHHSSQRRSVTIIDGMALSVSVMIKGLKKQQHHFNVIQASTALLLSVGISSPVRSSGKKAGSRTRKPLFGHESDITVEGAGPYG